MALLKMMRRGRLVPRTVVATLCVTLLLFVGPNAAAASREKASAEYQVKAVFLFNFALFVQWPESAFPDPRGPLVIGVLGDDPFGDYLDKVTAGEKIEEHRIEVKRFRSVDEVAVCHILFLSRSETGRIERILERLRGKSILTVSDSEDFCRRGGMIRFVTENGKIRLRVNVDSAKAAKLTISSKLLRPATIVTKERD